MFQMYQEKTRPTLAEAAIPYNPVPTTPGWQGIANYLFQTTTVNMNQIAWNYFIKQFIFTYANRELCTYSLANFRALLIPELMRYRTYMNVMSTDVIQRVMDAGFDITESVTTLVDEDRSRTGNRTGTESETGASTQTGTVDASQANTTKTTDSATGEQTTTDSETGTSGTTGTNTDKTDGSGTGTTSGTGQRKNTGTTTTDMDGTENRTNNQVGSVETGGTVTTNGTDKTDTTATGNTSNRELFSDTPQSMVNASTTGNPSDISWKYATNLRDNIGKTSSTTTADGENQSTTNNNQDTSTVSNGTDNLTIDRTDKTTDNRVEDSTNSETSETSNTSTSTGSHTVDTENERSGQSATNSKADSTSTVSGTQTSSENSENIASTTNNRTSDANTTENEAVDKTETMNRILSGLTPLEGNIQLYEFISNIMEEPIMKIVDEMDKLFISTYVDEERWWSFDWNNYSQITVV